MKNLLWTILALTACMMACTQSASHRDRMLLKAERVVENDPDSALSMIESIDAAELTADSMIARYAYVSAWAHLKQNRSMVGDSLIGRAYDYYRGKDAVKETRTAILTAWYKFWVGDTPGSIALFDSIISRNTIPDSLLLIPLRLRTLLGTSIYDGSGTAPVARRLYEMESDSLRKIEARYMLCEACQYSGQPDSALLLIDGLIDYAKSHNLDELRFKFTYEKVGVLQELQRYDESIKLADYILEHAPGNSLSHYLYWWKAMSRFNMGDVSGASHDLAIGDSLANGISEEEANYYRSFSNLLHAFIRQNQSGRLTFTDIAQVTNRQKERMNRAEASRWESEQSSLRHENRTLELKARNERQAAIIIIVILAALLIAGASLWYVRSRRRKASDAEERAETLQKMVDEFENRVVTGNNDTLRRAMLDRLNIIRMVAATPTEENRELLRKISSMNGAAEGALVNWASIYEVVDSLYGGFYSKLHEHYGTLLSDKEEQIIVLMAAGFSTKEISVITGQTTATIYVRKSSVRKKLGVAEKEDITAFLRKALAI